MESQNPELAYWALLSGNRELWETNILEGLGLGKGSTFQNGKTLY